MSDETDRRIWEWVLGGNARAFGLLFDRHKDRVFRHIRRNVETSADAEDLTAAAFLELWRRRHVVHFVDDSLLPWLLVTAGNVTRNATRARRRYRRFLSRLPEPDSSPDASDSIGEALDREPASTRLREQLDTLSATDRRLLELTAVEAYSLREASEAVGISYSAAKMRMSRLRTRLGPELSELNPRTENGAIS